MKDIIKNSRQLGPKDTGKEMGGLLKMAKSQINF